MSLTMSNQVSDNSHAILTVVSAILTAIGSLSFMQASGILVGIVCTIAVAISTIRTNRARRVYFEQHSRRSTPPEQID